MDGASGPDWWMVLVDLIGGYIIIQGTIIVL